MTRKTIESSIALITGGLVGIAMSTYLNFSSIVAVFACGAAVTVFTWRHQRPMSTFPTPTARTIRRIERRNRADLRIALKRRP